MRLRPEPFSGLYRVLWKGKNLSPRTLQYLHSILRQALGHAVKKGDLARNPTDHVSPAKQRKEEGASEAMPKRKIRAMTEEEAGRFLQAASVDRHHALWQVLLWGGLRPGEALGLLWDHVNLDESKLHVQQSLTRVGVKGWKLVPPKTDKGRRTVVLPEVAVAALRSWRAAQARERLQLGEEYEEAPGAGFVFTTEFGAPLDGSNIYARNFRRICAEAELGEWVEVRVGDRVKATKTRFKPKFRMYDLRHSCATLLLLAGESPKVVQERLGHADISLTLNVYSHVLPSMQEGAAQKLQAVAQRVSTGAVFGT